VREREEVNQGSSLARHPVAYPNIYDVSTLVESFVELVDLIISTR